MVLTLTVLSYISYDLYYHFIATIIHNINFATKHTQGSFYHIADGFLLCIVCMKKIVNCVKILFIIISLIMAIR